MAANCHIVNVLLPHETEGCSVLENAPNLIIICFGLIFILKINISAFHFKILSAIRVVT